MKFKNKKIDVQGTEITVSLINAEEYICITDIAKHKNAGKTDDLIRNWLRNRNTIEFLGIWETLYNPNFKPVESDGFKMLAGLNSFTLTPKQWIKSTNAVGLISKPGRYGGTYAHRDIAFEFASWISVEFKLYLIKEFQRLKTQEQKQLGWDIKRNLAKINYRIHTDAIKENLIPHELNSSQKNLVYATEADVLNMALFGMTAREWRDNNPSKKGNVRDDANISQLVCLSNLESLNAVFIKGLFLNNLYNFTCLFVHTLRCGNSYITLLCAYFYALVMNENPSQYCTVYFITSPNEEMEQTIRLEKLNKIAISQMKILVDGVRLPASTDAQLEGGVGAGDE